MNHGDGAKTLPRQRPQTYVLFHVSAPLRGSIIPQYPIGAVVYSYDASGGPPSPASVVHLFLTALGETFCLHPFFQGLLNVTPLGMAGETSSSIMESFFIALRFII